MILLEVCYLLFEHYLFFFLSLRFSIFIPLKLLHSFSSFALSLSPSSALLSPTFLPSFLFFPPYHSIHFFLPTSPFSLPPYLLSIFYLLISSTYYLLLSTVRPTLYILHFYLPTFSLPSFSLHLLSPSSALFNLSFLPPFFTSLPTYLATLLRSFP